MSFWRKASNWFNQAAKDTAEWTERAATDTVDWTGQAAEDTVDWTVQAAEDTVDWTVQAAEDTVDWLDRAVSDVGHGFNDVGEQIDRAAVNAWRAASDEANDMASAIEDAGLTIGEGFVAGAIVATDWLEERVEEIPDGIVALGRYVSSNACNIVVGSALTTAFVALALDGSEEVVMGGIATVCAVEVIDNAALNTLAKELAFILVEPIYLIPGVSEVLGLKAEAEALIAVLVVKACKQNPQVVVCTAGQFVAGMLIFALTKAICEGKVGGLRLWEGSQSVVPKW